MRYTTHSEYCQAMTLSSPQKVKQHTIGEKVRFFRRRFGISQLDLETAVGMSPGSIAKIESGKTKEPRLKTIFCIALVLKLSNPEIAYLLGVNLYEEAQIQDKDQRRQFLYQMKRLEALLDNQS